MGWLLLKKWWLSEIVNPRSCSHLLQAQLFIRAAQTNKQETKWVAPVEEKLLANENKLLLFLAPIILLLQEEVQTQSSNGSNVEHFDYLRPRCHVPVV
jgi:hypothetical protein